MYTPVNIDPEKGPRNYGDNSLYCGKCEVNGPLESHFKMCPQCHVGTMPKLGGVPDMRGPEAVKIFLEERFEEFYAEGKKQRALELDESFGKIVEAI